MLWGLMAGFTGICMAVSVVDARRQEIPDLMILALLGVGLVKQHLFGSVGQGVMVATAGFASLLALAMARAVLRGAPGLGGGDIKLFGAFCLWFGLETVEFASLEIPAVALLLIIAAAVQIAVMLARKNAGEMCFGPALCSAAVLCAVVTA